MGGTRRLWIVSIITIFLVSFTSSSFAQNMETEFIGDPGKWVSGPFLSLYHSVKNPEIIFGNPLTNEFTDPITGQRVQYFEKARFDLVENNINTTAISAPLGELLYVETEYKEAGIGNDPSVCHRFVNGMESCYGFWQFYLSNAGEKFLGQPLSNTLINPDGFLVQFFENGLLEWHPERQSGSRVMVADLGKLYFNEFVGDPKYTHTNPDTLPADIQLKPEVNVYVSSAIVPANSSQKIYVVVYDQYHQPIPGSMVGVKVILPDGSESLYRLPETNQAGISILELTIGDLNPREIIEVEAQVNSGNMITNGSAWFRIWW